MLNLPHRLRSNPGFMLEGFYEARKTTVGNRSHLGPQAMLWSRSLRGAHDDSSKKLRKEMDAKRRNRLRRNGVLRNTNLITEEEIAPRSSSQTPYSQESPQESPRRARPETAEVLGAKKLLKMLHLVHMLPDEEQDMEDVDTESQRYARTSKKKVVKEKTKRGSQRRSTSSKKALSKDPSPAKREVSPLTSWRRSTSLPEILQNNLNAKKEEVNMLGQNCVKVPVESDQESEEDDGSPITQWRYKPLPGEDRKVTKLTDGGDCDNPEKDRRTEKPRFDLDDLRIVVVAMQKEHRECIRSVTENLAHHTRQIALLTKANSSLADHVEMMENEIKVLRAMQYVCSTIS